MEYTTVLTLAHLMGLIAGFGGALYADYLIITKGVLSKLEQKTVDEVERLGLFVAGGLLVLWVTGGALVLDNIQSGQALLSNDKFWAKLLIVSVLTVNGAAIHFFVLREAKRKIGSRLLVDNSVVSAVLLAGCGAVSAVSWITPFVLGKASELNFVVPFVTIVSTWAAAIFLLGGMTLLLLAVFHVIRLLTKRRLELLTTAS